MGRVGRRRARGAAAGPGDFLSVDLAGERVIVVRDRAGGLSAHYDLCRHRGSRLTTADQRTEPGELRRRRPVGHVQGDHPLHLPLVVLRAGRRGPQRAVPRRGGPLRAGRLRPPPGRPRHVGRLDLRQRLAGAGRRRAHARRAAGRDPGAHRPLPAGRPPDGAPDRLRRPRQLEGHRRELQRVLPLRGRPPGAVPDRAGVPGEGRREPRLGRRRARRPRARSRSR